MMKHYLILAVLSITMSAQSQQRLQGTIDIKDGKTTGPVVLIGELSHDLCAGDKIKLKVSGSVNVRPYDEERKGGGFLGLFKKRYKVRIDDWRDASAVSFQTELRNETMTEVLNVPRGADNTVRGIQIHKDNIGKFTTYYRLYAWVDEAKTPLCTGKLTVALEIEPSDRIPMLGEYLKQTYIPAERPILEVPEIVGLIEKGNMLKKYPDSVVATVFRSLIDHPSLPLIKKDFLKYLLEKAPNSTAIRNEIASVYLNELNFGQASIEAKEVIKRLLSKPLNTLTEPEMAELGKSYSILGAVDELQELGTQKDAYTLAATYFGESAEWFRKGNYTDNYSQAVLQQVRCLQKVGSKESLKQAEAVLLTYISVIGGAI
ncbi:MAG: hypothetical protein EOO01_00860 [Chitinophagaceae bacterium]|nr:MAG: hypothetical protein EOO01_00860 [Chitinophagaceae bacterium]